MARTKAEKLWIGGGAAASVLVAAGIWTFAVSPEISLTDSVRTQIADAQTQNLSLETNVGRLKRQYDGIAKLRTTLDAAHAALPGDGAPSAFTKQISAQAAAAHVTVSSLTIGAPTAVGANGQAGVPAPASTGSSSAPAAPATSTGAGGLFAIPVTVVVNGSTGATMTFLHLVQESGPRAALVTTSALTGLGSGSGPAGTATLTLTMSIFASTAAAPAPSASPSSTPTATPTTGP